MALFHLAAQSALVLCMQPVRRKYEQHMDCITRHCVLQAIRSGCVAQGVRDYLNQNSTSSNIIQHAIQPSHKQQRAASPPCPALPPPISIHIWACLDIVSFHVDPPVKMKCTSIF